MKDKDSITIPKKALIWISPVVGISVVLIAKDKAPELLLFLIGVTSGVLIGKAYFAKEEKTESEK